MAKNGKQRKIEKVNSPKLKAETKHGIKAVIFFVLALFFLMSAFGLAGMAGEVVYEKLHYLLGVGYILLPTLLALLGSSFIKADGPNFGWARVLSSTMFLLSGLGIMDVLMGENAGGLLGRILSVPFVTLFEVYASVIFLFAILLISILIMFDTQLDIASAIKRIWALMMRKKEPKTPPRKKVLAIKLKKLSV